MVKSPLNYTGGKFKLLPQLLPLFPQNTGTFVDLFCGGGDVGANVQARTVVFNDIDRNVVALLRTFAQTDPDRLIGAIDAIIAHYGLSDTFRKGYGHYAADSARGLADVNREAFLALRHDLNAMRPDTARYMQTLYTTIVYAFNNQIRFNSAGEYNLPVGKRDFNARMRLKLGKFAERLAALDYRFSAHDFENFNFTSLTPEDLVYADPPYLITCASYNENGGWTRERERALYTKLDNLHAAGIRFALSNVLESKGRRNSILAEWLAQRPEYTVNHLNFNYTNSNYHTKGRREVCDEVLITNY